MAERACFLLVALSITACSVDDVDGVFGRTGNNGGASGDGGSNGALNGPNGNGGESNGPTMTNGPVTNTVTNGPGPTTVTNTVTTGPEPQTVELFCANAPCAANEVCCYYQFAKGQDHCAAAGECPGQDGWFEIGCNGPADCESGHCCGKWNNQVGWYEVQCAAECGGGDELEMCYGDDSVCNGGACDDSQALGTGYSFCGD
jgi:hypothetical protein